MCEAPASSGSGGGGSKGAVAVVAVLGASVLAYACDPTGTPAAKTAPAAPHAGFPWLTVSATALATLALAALVVTAVLAVRRRRAAERARREAASRRTVARRAPQRAIEAARPRAQAWLDGRIDAR